MKANKRSPASVFQSVWKTGIRHTDAAVIGAGMFCTDSNGQIKMSNIVCEKSSLVPQSAEL